MKYFEKSINMTHDESVDWLMQLRNRLSQEFVVQLFLASLSTRNLEWRSGLAAYAVSLHFPPHTVKAFPEEYNCSICGADLFTEQKFPELIEQYRMQTGGFMDISAGAFVPAYYLNSLSQVEPVEAKEEDYAIFKSIIQILDADNSGLKSVEIERKIRDIKGFRSNSHQRRAILETLAFCGVLETPEHRGYMLVYQNFESREQRVLGGSRNDKFYPYRFWTPAHGINHEALVDWGFFDYYRDTK